MNGPEDDEVPLEILERRARPLRELLQSPRPGDRWPYEPAAPKDDGSGGAGVREPRRPRAPAGSEPAALVIEPEPASEPFEGTPDREHRP